MSHLLIRRLCDSKILRCGDSSFALDITDMDFRKITEGIADSIQTWMLAYTNDCRSRRFWGAVCMQLYLPKSDSSYLAKAIRMYHEAYWGGCTDVSHDFSKAINYYAEILSESFKPDSAFSLYVIGVLVTPSNHKCLTGLVNTAQSTAQIDSAVSHVQHVDAMSDSTRYRTLWALLQNRIMHKETVKPLELKKWMDSTLTILGVCKQKGHLKRPEIERKVDSLYEQVKKKKGGDFRAPAVAFLDSALADGLANPNRYCDLADAYLELVEDEGSPDKALMLWMDSREACSECEDHSKDSGKTCYEKLCDKIVEILDELSPAARVSCGILTTFFEKLAQHHCDDKEKDRLRTYLKPKCRVNADSLQDVADSLWLTGDPAAEGKYNKALLYDRRLPRSLYKLALIAFLDSLEHGDSKCDTTEQLLKQARGLEKNSKRDLLYEGLDKLVSHRYSGAVNRLDKALKNPPSDPDVAYCRALAERLWVDNLLKQDSLCEAAWHLELSENAYLSAVELFKRRWPEVTDNWITDESDSLTKHHSQIVGNCIAGVETQMSVWIRSKEYDEVIEEFSNLSQRFPDSLNENIYLALGDAYVGLRSYDEAASAYQAVLSIDPSNAWGLLNVGIEKSRNILKGQDPSTTDSAITSLRTAVLHPPEKKRKSFNNLAHYHLARALILSGNPADKSEGCSLLPKVKFSDEQMKDKVEELDNACKTD